VKPSKPPPPENQETARHDEDDKTEMDEDDEVSQKSIQHGWSPLYIDALVN